jgi:serine/threonine-protein kinase
MSTESTGKGGRRPYRIGRYEVLYHIASGGMGAVYKAVDVELGREVALKVLPPEIAVNPSMMERFRREAKAAAQLHHENIVAIHEFGEAGGTYYLALEFVDGIDLHEYIKERGRLRPDEARDLLKQAVKALAHAHSMGIIHRDIKPSNFLITQKDGQPLLKLTDLGLARQAREEEARVTRDGTTVGTVDYMSPEQAHDASMCDIRSDLYSLGCTFYHMLAGHPPFNEGSLIERLTKHVNVDPPDIRELNADVPDDLKHILERMLRKRPEDRYQTPVELIRDLLNPEQIQIDLPRLVPLDPPPPVPKKSRDTALLMEPDLKRRIADEAQKPTPKPPETKVRPVTAATDSGEDDANASVEKPRPTRKRRRGADDDRTKKSKKHPKTWIALAAVCAAVLLVFAVVITVDVVRSLSPQKTQDDTGKATRINRGVDTSKR